MLSIKLGWTASCPPAHLKRGLAHGGGGGGGEGSATLQGCDPARERLDAALEEVGGLGGGGREQVELSKLVGQAELSKLVRPQWQL